VTLAPPTLRALSGAEEPEATDPERRRHSDVHRPIVDDPDRAWERVVVERLQAGDRSALRDLYEAHAAAVLRCAILPLCRDAVVAEDLLADTFVRALQHVDKFRWQGRGMLPWLVRIAKNLSLDHLRRRGRLASFPEGGAERLPDPAQASAAIEAIGLVEVGTVLRERIEVCMEEMHPRYRRVIELRLVERRARADAAKELEVSIGTLDVLLFRACKAFRKLYVARFGGSPDDPEFFAP
jgi:RNA polymerase sigma-70 factor (ECF subfamily)